LMPRCFWQSESHQVKQETSSFTFRVSSKV
jgi:hypothetical protein